ncbi:MAG: hypothetical protein GWN18_18990, partial [Thermoplasmata archaeon]|nr:hypothetical protein [Thermoplasmata archaeon]NIS14223.1 hypothetical protein [Thermoplasmata archaeon]NIS22058.1 hypothetical protein [Thermoplasmata archaeon]NIT79932.1 hypothetical protein [Thermoplasmata archaeon]NIU51079.1 hypothetical protein [Thermoplasmata archaeon]
SSFHLAPPASGAPGDLAAPVYSDGDWWNRTWDGDHDLLASAGDYAIEFEKVQGWVKHTVDGTTSHLG